MAEEKNPTDTIVISNIALSFHITGDIDASLEYYEKLIQYGNEEEREYAEQQIRKLKKWRINRRNLMKYRNIIFDLDGTIIDSEAGITKSVHMPCKSSIS